MGLTRDPLFEVYTQTLNWKDIIGPIKYEPPELIRFISVIPEIAARIEGIETYLASGAKQPFVRASERLGAEGMAQMQRSVETMTKRLDSIEQQLSKGK